MTDPFEMQKRYFTVQLEKYGARPELHEAMIADCNHYLSLLDEAGSPGAFKRKVQQTGNMLSTGKANATDRYRNRCALYSALGHEMKARENRERLSVIEGASTQAELSSMLTEFEENAGLGKLEDQALNALGSVISSLFQLCTDGAGSLDRKRHLAVFQEYWKQMREADPSVTWEKIMTHRPYRDRIPFTDFQMGFLEGVFMEVCGG